MTRRDALLKLLFGAGGIGLRSLATGIPAGLLMHPERAFAAASGPIPQFVIFSGSGQGDPINANAPGTYDDPTIGHSTNDAMTARPMTIGNRQVNAAKVWAGLADNVLKQTAFFHHATLTGVHTDATKVLTLNGAVAQGEMLPSMLGQKLAPLLQTIRSQPVNFNGDALESITSQGQLQPMLTPTSMAAMVSLPDGRLGDPNLVALRDTSLDDLNRWAKSRGRAFQSAFIDQYALSQTQVRSLQGEVISQLASITGNDPTSQIRAALILFKAGLSPVVMISLPFGGDNHDDVNFSGEVRDHLASVPILGQLPTLISSMSLTGQVTFCLMNVFGRTLAKSITQKGRDHNGSHAVSLIIGPHVKGSVVGGVVADTTDTGHSATSIDSTTGNASANGDITLASSLASFGKTLVVAAGLPQSVADSAILSGTTVAGAVNL